MRLLLEQRRGGEGALNLGMRHRMSALATLTLALAALTRKPRLAAASLLAVLALNRPFYSLLHRRGGLELLLGGVGLHLLHQLVAIASVPAALILHLRSAVPFVRIGHKRNSGREGGW